MGLLNSLASGNGIGLQEMGTAAIAFVVLYAVYCIAYGLFLSPLRHLPGPLICKITSLPYTYHTLRGYKAVWIKSLQDNYSPMVVVKPGFVVVSDASLLKTIYGFKQIKSDFYKGYGSINGHQLMLGVPDCATRNAAYTARKNLVQVFSQQNLLEMAPVMQSHLAEFNQHIEKFSKSGTPINTYAWFRMLTFDIISDLVFNGQFHIVEKGDPNHDFIRSIDCHVAHHSTVAQYPFLDPLIDILPFKKLKKWKSDSYGLVKYGEEALFQYNADVAAGVEKHKRNILTKLKESDDDISHDQLVAILCEVLLAGSDTTSTTASFLAFELSMNLEVQNKIRQELKDTLPNADQCDPITLLKLPWLDAAIKETLRLYPIVPGPLERHLREPITVGKYVIPPMTMVGMQALTAHLDPTVYPNPKKFLPERWFNETNMMKTMSLAFSTGPRNCAGMNLATFELKLHMGTILRKYSISAPPYTTRQSLELREYFFNVPSNHRIDLIFSRDE